MQRDRLKEEIQLTLRNGQRIVVLMRERLLVALLLVSNAVWVGMIWSLSRNASDPVSLRAAEQAHFSRAALARTIKPTPGVVVRRQFFTWGEVESDDFRKYIANLRAINCPEATIRDLIVAEVDELYTQRRAAELTPTDMAWWKSETDISLAQLALARDGALESERRALLDELLGPGWRKDPPQISTAAARFTGAVLSALPESVQNAVLEIEQASFSKLQALETAAAESGGAVTPAQVTRLRLETRATLAKILSPDQLEEYLLRYSANSADMRSELKGFGATPEEFRTIFRARDAIDNEIGALADKTDASSAKRRKELEANRDASIRQALGPSRFPLYQLAQDPAFRDAQSLAEKSGLAPERVMSLYELNHQGQLQRERIRKDTSMSEEQQKAALEGVTRDLQQAQALIIGGTNRATGTQ